MVDSVVGDVDGLVDDRDEVSDGLNDGEEGIFVMDDD